MDESRRGGGWRLNSHPTWKGDQRLESKVNSVGVEDEWECVSRESIPFDRSITSHHYTPSLPPPFWSLFITCTTPSQCNDDVIVIDIILIVHIPFCCCRVRGCDRSEVPFCQGRLSRWPKNVPYRWRVPQEANGFHQLHLSMPPHSKCIQLCFCFVLIEKFTCGNGQDEMGDDEDDDGKRRHFVVSTRIVVSWQENLDSGALLCSCKVEQRLTTPGGVLSTRTPPSRHILCSALAPHSSPLFTPANQTHRLVSISLLFFFFLPSFFLLNPTFFNSLFNIQESCVIINTR